MGKTSIEWTDASWNPVVGCTEVSPGCANCYAARLAATRLKNLPDYKGLAFQRNGRLDDVQSNHKYLAIHPHWRGEVRFLTERLEEPLHWRKPRRIFVCDMGDLFHESVPRIKLWDIFNTISRCPQHTFQILTKRPWNMREFFDQNVIAGRLFLGDGTTCEWPLPNVWLGVSVENQHFADERIPLLLQTPAAVRFISAEPLLGQLDLNKVLAGGIPCYGKKLDWVICGGESGANARPMHPDWARSLRDQCVAAGVPFFFKQWGEWSFSQTYYRKLPAHRVKSFEEILCYRVGKRKSGRLLDGREWNEFPVVG